MTPLEYIGAFALLALAIGLSGLLSATVFYEWACYLSLVWKARNRDD